jgi:hypothetical protein
MALGEPWGHLGGWPATAGRPERGARRDPTLAQPGLQPGTGPDLARPGRDSQPCGVGVRHCL